MSDCDDISEYAEITQAWVRNASDEKAVANGCFFKPEVAAYVVYWIEKNCKLYEGDYAGESIYLWGCHQCGNYELTPSDQFACWDDALPTALERMHRYLECRAAGHRCDWQYESTMRLFGWAVKSKKWKRHVRRFRQGVIFVPKKNKKSPTASAIGIYLTCGDGEQGAHVYFGHKDGDAAKKIMGEHARMMILQSTKFAPPHGYCKINGTTMRISHTPSNSYMEPMSSSNARTQKAKEGLNGSVIFDELHIVDRDLVRRTSRMGISRSEPMQLEISTAGNDPDSYGYERFKYALEVERGDREDQKLFVAIYAAPQDISDEELKAAPLKYGYLANPAMGQTIEDVEFLDDFKSSQKTIQDWLDFKMYRLNIWQKGSNPWLRASDWSACAEDYGEDDLAGKECWLSLDLSRTKDMCAAAFLFKEMRPDDRLHIRSLVYFWLPEARMLELEGSGVLPEWVRDGWLEVLQGQETISLSFIEGRLRQLAEKFIIKEITFDPKYAEDITASLSEGRYDDKGMLIQEGLGIERYAFAQQDNEFAQPTADFERMVLDHTFHHNGNPVLAWQAGHVQVMVKTSKVKRAVKPNALSHKTIDGIIACIMGTGRALQAVEENWYTPGSLK